MDLLSIVLLVVFGFSSVLLILIILLQDDQGEGLGGIFGGGSSNQVGNRKGNILTKATTILGALFLIIAFGMAWMNKHNASAVGVLDKEDKKSQATYEWWNKEAQPSPAADASASPAPLDSSAPQTSLEASASPAGSAQPSASASSSSR